MAVDAAAHEAATSPKNDHPEPTQAQKEAGNYRLGHTRIAGLDLSIENPAGSTRRGVDENGKAWESELQHHYGYIRRTTGADGDHVDVFVKPGTPADYDGSVFIVDQVNPKTGAFDEHKVILGAKDRADAEATYRANYAKDWQGLKAITGMSMPAFKKWVGGAETSKPVGSLKDRVEQMRQRREPAAAATSAAPATAVREPGAPSSNSNPGFEPTAQRTAESAPAAQEEKQASTLRARAEAMRNRPGDAPATAKALRQRPAALIEALKRESALQSLLTCLG